MFDANIVPRKEQQEQLPYGTYNALRCILNQIASNPEGNLCKKKVNLICFAVLLTPSEIIKRIQPWFTVCNDANGQTCNNIPPYQRWAKPEVEPVLRKVQPGWVNLMLSYFVNVPPQAKAN